MNKSTREAARQILHSPKAEYISPARITNVKTSLKNAIKEEMERMDAAAVKNAVLNNKSGKPQMFINASTLDKYIDVRVSERVKIELQKRLPKR